MTERAASRMGSHVHLDIVGGIAGDMFVAAMLDALPRLRDQVFADIRAVLPRDVVEPELRAGSSAGLRACRFLWSSHSEATQAGASPHHPDHHDDDGGRTGPHHRAHYGQDELGQHQEEERHRHRACAHGSFRDLERMIRDADLAPTTTDPAMAILTAIAEVEATIHGVALADVHFHELAGWDSLTDVVAAGSIIGALQGASWSVSDLPRGRGLVKTEHGLLPIPAPATAALLSGFRWHDDGIAGERVTPTGASILRHVMRERGRQTSPPGRLVAVGTGAGTRELGQHPNILRALVFELDGDGQGETIAVLSFDVDDMTGEEIGTAADRLRSISGVVEVTVGTRLGKKGRPVHDFVLLVRPDAFDRVNEAVFLETSTIGLRWRMEQRECLARRARGVAVDGAQVMVKDVVRPDGRTTTKIEAEELRSIDGLEHRRDIKIRAEKGSSTP